MNFVFVSVFAYNVISCSQCPLCDRTTNILDWSCAKDKLGYSNQSGCPTKESVKNYKVTTPKGNKRRITND